MKTIVIAGAGSKVGKTTILRSIKTLFNDSVSVKLGKPETKAKDKEELLLPSHSSLEEIKNYLPLEPEYLLIEGNTILKDFQPDLAIFVEGKTASRREDADDLKQRCDLVVGEYVSCKAAFILAKKVNLNSLKFGEFLNKLKVKIKHCQLGCF